jgi:flagellar basal body-associated protein FliL
MEKKGKKGRFSKLIVTLVVILNILFTAAVLYIFLCTGNEPTTLIGCWFGFTTIELWALAGIKKKEIEKQNDKEEM